MFFRDNFVFDYSVSIGIINGCEAVGGMRIGKGNRSTFVIIIYLSAIGF
jgi:hypothetical protein